MTCLPFRRCASASVNATGTVGETECVGGLDWINGLIQRGTAKHVYTKLGRGAVIIFDVDSHETLHKLVNQWNECVPATFEVEALLPKEHQERIAMAGTDPMRL